MNNHSLHKFAMDSKGKMQDVGKTCRTKHDKCRELRENYLQVLCMKCQKPTGFAKVSSKVEGLFRLQCYVFEPFRRKRNLCKLTCACVRVCDAWERANSIRGWQSNLTCMCDTLRRYAFLILVWIKVHLGSKT